MLLMIPACSAEVLEVYSWADTVPLGPGVKISAASRSPSVTCLRATTAVGADLTVTPLSASSVSTTWVAAGELVVRATAMVPASIGWPNSSPSSVIRMIGKSSDQNSVIRRRKIIRSMAAVVAR